jgi:hypothetical protein
MRLYRVRGARRFWLFMLVAFFFVPAVILVLAAARTHPQPTVVHVSNTEHPAVSVRAAIAKTAGADRFDFVSSTTATPPGLSLQAHGTMNVHPRAMVATSQVGGLGEVTSWVNSTTVWERGGGQYGLTPGAPTGPGAPLSGFAPLVQSSLGRREGAVAMMGLASPTGQLELADSVVSSATKLGSATVDGVGVTEYELTFDAGALVKRPDMSDEERAAASTAYATIRQEGYQHTVARVSVDDAGLIRRVQSVAAFADGGMVSSDVKFSNFGTAPVVEMPTS